MEEDPIVLPERWEMWAGFSVTLTVLCVIVLALWIGRESSANMEKVPCAGISDPLECEFELFFGVPPTHDKAEKKVALRLAEIYDSACVDSLRTELKKAVNEMAMAERLAESFGLFVPFKHKFLRWERRCPNGHEKYGDHPSRDDRRFAL